MSHAGLRLTAAELLEITGLSQPRRQLAELRAHGFTRARLGRDGQVILERAHYEAVCRGEFAPAAARVDTNRPQLRAIRPAA